MIDHLRVIVPKLSELFSTEFIKHVCFYFTIFNQVSTLSTPQATALTKLLANLSHIDRAGCVSLGTLKEYWKDATNIQSDKKFLNFIGLCLFLANVRRTFGDRSDPKVRLLDANELVYGCLLYSDI
jgi:hypothetical protein